MAQVKDRTPAETSLYERDFARWAEEQARLLRTGRLTELDLPNLIDEVEDLSGSQRRALRSNLTVVLQHLLKWQVHHAGRPNSWRASIVEHRQRIDDGFEESPSLRSYPADVFAKCYGRARVRAAAEMGVPIANLPEIPPFTVEEALDPDFLPE